MTTNSYRNYTGILTLTITSPDGQIVAVKAVNVDLPLEISPFLCSSDADVAMKDEAYILLRHGGRAVKETFNTIHATTTAISKYLI